MRSNTWSDEEADASSNENEEAEEGTESAEHEGVSEMAPMLEPDLIVESVVPLGWPRDTSRCLALRIVYATASSSELAAASVRSLV